ncbi:MAG: hypothetical protein HOP30_02050 [Cyclobacteriaceae bacterium]|nr:hypothetical protein [Cyclobacteriaceae bacterium]
MMLKLRRPLFWDIKESDIEKVIAESPEWVIPRVFDYGTLADIREVINLYGEEKTKEMLSRNKMKPLVRSMAYLFLQFDPEKRYAS